MLKIRNILFYLYIFLFSILFQNELLSNEQKKILWFYYYLNFQVSEQVDKLIIIMKEAKKLGYTGIQINDAKFGQMEGRPNHFYLNLNRLIEAAKELQLDLAPGVMPIGYSNPLLLNNPNLAEGIAVKDCEFIVKNNQATVLDETNYINGGDLEIIDKNKPQGWDWVDGYGTSLTLDASTKQNGNFSAKLTNFKEANKAANCRLNQTLTLKPWHEYEITYWVKTKDFEANQAKVTLLGEKDQTLCYTNSGIKKNEEWAKRQIIFNTLDNSKIKFYIGVWGGKTGTLWLDTISLKTIAGVNMLRRQGCPIRVFNVKKSIEYIENVDFEKWEYEKLGSDPYPGAYHVIQPQPPIRLTKNSRIKEGQKLLVSFYHTVVMHDSQVCSCLTEKEIYTILEQQIQQIQKYFKPNYFFMNHDELRIVGQCELCKKSGKTSGQLLADNVKSCEAIIKKYSPQATILVWSDMFDPFHNAIDNYYLAGSSLKDSWKGLSSNTIISNWNHQKIKDSLTFFATRNHKQLVAGYYDTSDFEKTLEQWFEADKNLNSILGYMYTTWTHDYSRLEDFAKAVQKSNKFK